MFQRRKLLLSLLAAGLFLASAAWAAKEFRVYRGLEEQADYTELPADFEKPAGIRDCPPDVPLRQGRLWFRRLSRR